MRNMMGRLGVTLVSHANHVSVLRYDDIMYGNGGSVACSKAENVGDIV